MKRLVVVGGCGHIGSALLRSLPYQTSVTVIDNFSTQRFASTFGLSPNISVVEADILTADLVPFFAEADVVIHLAALTDAVNSLAHAAEYQRVNVDGLWKVAVACMATGTPLIFPSSTSVYGAQTDTVDESLPYEAMTPGSPYALSKWQGERDLLNLFGASGLRFAILRLGTIFGTAGGRAVGWRQHTAVNRFAWQAARQQPLTVYDGAWDQKRPYLDLQDAIRAIEWVMAGDRFDGTVRNVLTGNYGVGEVVEEIRKWVPDLRVQTVPNPLLNQVGFTVSAERIKAEGFHSAGSLARGVEETMRLLVPGLK